jgi:hypothetical protein
VTDLPDHSIDAAIDRLDDDALTANCARIPADGDDSSGAPAILADTDPDDEADTDRLIDEIVIFIESRMVGHRAADHARHAEAMLVPQ